MSRNACAAVHERFEAHGDLYFTMSGGEPLFVTRHPDHIHEVLVTRADDWQKRGDLSAFLGKGLLTANGAQWREHRRQVQPGFRRERLQRYAETVVAAADALSEEWAAQSERDVGQDMMTSTLMIVGKTLFDYEAGHDVGPIAEAMDVLQGSVGFDPIPRWVPTPSHLRVRRARAELDRIVYGLIEARRRHPRGQDLLGHLLEEGKMSDAQLRDELVTLFLAGHETTALSLTWSWEYLARNPEWAERVEAEVDEVLGDRKPSFEDLEALELCRRVVQEAMRLRPPVYALPRVAGKATELGGYPVEAGAEVVMWPYWAHHDARWFPDPERFDPDRFLPGAPGIRHPKAYLPFGAGQRACIGRNFAMMEAQLLLARWSQGFRLGYRETRPAPAISPRITLGTQEPVRMWASPR